MDEKLPSKGKQKIFDACPHCGRELSPWEKVLLGIDRALMCKHCWYRIILEVEEEEQPSDSSTRKGTLL